jgi:hypothetical protein
VIYMIEGLSGLVSEPDRDLLDWKDYQDWCLNHDSDRDSLDLRMIRIEV